MITEEQGKKGAAIQSAACGAFADHGAVSSVRPGAPALSADESQGRSPGFGISAPARLPIRPRYSGNVNRNCPSRWRSRAGFSPASLFSRPALRPRAP